MSRISEIRDDLAAQLAVLGETVCTISPTEASDSPGLLVLAGARWLTADIRPPRIVVYPAGSKCSLQSAQVALESGRIVTSPLRRDLQIKIDILTPLLQSGDGYDYQDSLSDNVLIALRLAGLTPTGVDEQEEQYDDSPTIDTRGDHLVVTATIGVSVVPAIPLTGTVIQDLPISPAAPAAVEITEVSIT